jgi:catechol-2,3-dioxygenase
MMNSDYLISEPRIEHVCIFALNLNDLKTWYQKIFGFTSIYMEGKETNFIRGANGIILEFIAADTAESQTDKNISGFRHLAFSLDSYNGLEEKLMAMNIKIVNKSSSSTGDTKMLFLHDPEGNLLQLVYRKTPL